MSMRFVPEALPPIAINDRVQLLKSVKSSNVLLTPGMFGVVLADYKPEFGVRFEGTTKTLNVNARFLQKVAANAAAPEKGA